MDIKVQSGDVLHAPSDLAVLACFEDVPLPTEVAGLLEAEDFRGRVKQTLLLYPRGAVTPRRLLLIGLGKRAALTAEGIRQASALAVQHARSLQVSGLTISVNREVPLPVDVAAQAFGEGLELGAYRYWHYRTGLTNEQTFQVERATVFTSADEAQTRAGV